MDTAARTPETATDRQGLEVLDTGESMRLLASEPVGRFACVLDGGPLVLPVNHVVDGWTVAFRSTFGAKLVAAAREQTVAFQADGYDAASRTGWSVLLTGTAERVLDDEVIARLEELGLEPWANRVERPHWVRIHPDEISGRRIT